MGIVKHGVSVIARIDEHVKMLVKDDEKKFRPRRKFLDILLTNSDICFKGTRKKYLPIVTSGECHGYAHLRKQAHNL